MTTLGVVIGCLTLRLNPQAHARPGDALRLIAILGLAFAVAGLLLGAAAGVCLLIGSAAAGPRLSASGRRRLESAVLGVLGFGPLLWAVLLPDVGLATNSLTWFIFTPGIVGKLVALLGVVLVLGGAGVLVRPAIGAMRRRVGLAAGSTAAIGVSIVLVCGMVWGWFTGPGELSGLGTTATGELELPAQPLFDDAAPVILLCIDGADPDDVILPMISDGELPNFERLIREGTWGELESFAPTLSPAVWTTLATGRTKNDHGIHGFTVFQLPTLKTSILEFPLHSGLNFKLIPWLERIPGVPLMRLPYTSDMRRVPALWNMAGRYYPVGVFGWRATWPVEAVNGFAVASAVTLGETELGTETKRHPELLRHPAGLYQGLPPAPELPGFDEVSVYLSPGAPLEPDDPRIRIIRSSMNRSNAQTLIHLIRNFEPRLTAAAFYSVDAFNHYFGADRMRGGPFAPALAERYRFADERLGELMDAFGPEVNLIVVSDHGYDFIDNNHAHAPPGVFLARGPAFSHGRHVRGLTVFDVTPLALHLLGLPPGRDMPGAETGAYLGALDPEWAAMHPVGTVPSWGSTVSAALRPRVDGGERDILEELRSLGYLE